MKIILTLLAAISLAGCSHLPKDSLLRNVEIGATPWTPTMKIELAATGKAAQNLTAEERKEILAATKEKK